MNMIRHAFDTKQVLFGQGSYGSRPSVSAAQPSN